MKKGFTIIELLVASLLLGMLVTILTMIFNQSSIAWRTGVAGVADLDEVRNNTACVREYADNAFVWNNQGHRILGLWREDGQLRNRACDSSEETDGNPRTETDRFFQLPNALSPSNLKLQDIKTKEVGNGDNGGNFSTYTINVMSAGPNRTPDDYDDIWSFPDDFEM